MITDLQSLNEFTRSFLDKYAAQIRARSPQVSRGELAVFFKLFVGEVESGRPGHFYHVFEHVFGDKFEALLSEVRRFGEAHA